MVGTRTAIPPIERRVTTGEMTGAGMASEHAARHRANEYLTEKVEPEWVKVEFREIPRRVGVHLGLQEER